MVVAEGGVWIWRKATTRLRLSDELAAVFQDFGSDIFCCCRSEPFPCAGGLFGHDAASVAFAADVDLYQRGGGDSRRDWHLCAGGSKILRVGIDCAARGGFSGESSRRASRAHARFRFFALDPVVAAAASTRDDRLGLVDDARAGPERNARLETVRLNSVLKSWSGFRTNRQKFLFPTPAKIVTLSVMSEENVPKLRLKPKLAAEPVVVPPPPGLAPAAPVTPPAPVPTANEPKAVRLKPKLAPPPAQESAPPPPAAPAETGALPPWGASGAFSAPTYAPTNPPPEPLPPVEKSGTKFMLRPKAPAETPPKEPPAVPPPPVEIPAPAPASQETVPPPPLFLDAELGGESPGATIPAPLTARPFPPPPANFPPPAGSANRPAPPWSQPKVVKGSASKVVKMGASVLVAIAIAGGGFIAYKKFMVPRPAPQPVPAPEAVEPPAPAADEAKSEPSTTEAEPKAVAPVVKAQPAPKPAEAYEPPPPSAAFKAWVDGLRVGGVRTGANTRVFISGTAYEPGELVNPQLGITFEGYDSATRHLIFKDKSGATVERRN